MTWTRGDSPPGAPLTLGHNKFAHLHHSHFLTRRLLGARGRVGAHAECVSVMWFRDVGGGPLFLGPARCSRSLVGSAHLGFASGSGAPTLQAVGHWRRRASLQAKAEVSSAHTIGTDTLTQTHTDARTHTHTYTETNAHTRARARADSQTRIHTHTHS